MQLFNLETIRLGLNSLKLHKLRSLLTSLGIIFGVAAVICMLSISEGASADELRMIELLGTKNIIVNSVKPPTTAQNTQSNSNMHAIKLSVMKTNRLPEVARPATGGVAPTPLPPPPEIHPF